MPCFGSKVPVEDVDVLLVGGGVMSATVGVLLQKLNPDWKIRMFERLGAVGLESSNAWNNAGTGHAALCEPNYTPADSNGKIDPAKAIGINEQWMLSREMWSTLIKQGHMQNDFLETTPHVCFVRGEKDVAWLKERMRVLGDQPLFEGMKFSEDPDEIREWSPLLVEGRDEKEKIAATYVHSGTDVDFGALTRGLVHTLTHNGGSCTLYHSVTSLKKEKDGRWRAKVSARDIGKGCRDYRAKFVFVGAGGWSLPVLQQAGIKEIRGFGGFPISGEFLVCQDEDVVKKHNLKVYGRAGIGAPPMSVPHLDKRVIDGKHMLLFGPYAGFSPRFLKTGGMMDLVKSIKWHNLIPMAAAGLQSLDLTVYLVKELVASKQKRLNSLREYCPDARGKDWTLVTAGQRVQVMKKDPKKIGILQFGTEVVSSEDGTICGLLGASPGASISVAVGIDVLKKCFSKAQFDEWTPAIRELCPTYGFKLNENPEMCKAALNQTANTLGIRSE